VAHYESVLGIPWESSKSDAETDCYFTYVCQQVRSSLADPEGPHGLSHNDIDDCLQVVFLHCNRCLKYFDPSKSKISTFMTRMIKQGVHQYLKSHYGGDQFIPFSEAEQNSPHDFAMSTAYEPSEDGGRIGLHSRTPKRMRRVIVDIEEVRLEDADEDENATDTTTDEQDSADVSEMPAAIPSAPERPVAAR
jgi:DNA-directed RNA polymerase specialized sigma24 family protein